MIKSNQRLVIFAHKLYATDPNIKHKTKVDLKNKATFHDALKDVTVLLPWSHKYDNAYRFWPTRECIGFVHVDSRLMAAIDVDRHHQDVKYLDNTQSLPRYLLLIKLILFKFKFYTRYIEKKMFSHYKNVYFIIQQNTQHSVDKLMKINNNYKNNIRTITLRLLLETQPRSIKHNYHHLKICCLKNHHPILFDQEIHYTTLHLILELMHFLDYLNQLCFLEPQKGNDLDQMVMLELKTHPAIHPKI
ncbi:hypothetical protein AGLY_005335 [Aphis glycines]|uniref:Uncharacterized protein n=1 Tax=Aphis glycines TaxID=307491 RepID=A0A6G0TYV9_APHGL|nr:hypothetical protein AGLY_005335 [Aphis glycines]